jgi:hypothetical protein
MYRVDDYGTRFQARFTAVTMNEMGVELQELVLEALDLAVGCFSEGEQNPFVIFHDRAGKSQLIDVKGADGNIDPQLVDDARRIVSEVIDQPQRYAIAYDGYLTTDGVKYDAAFVEAGERGEPEAFVVAQCYRVKKRKKGVEKVGNPLIVASAKLLIV